MADSSTTPAVPVRTVTPCVCCRERPHAHIPDRDLEGYVCKQCARLLRIGEAVAAREGIKGCAPEKEQK